MYKSIKASDPELSLRIKTRLVKKHLVVFAALFLVGQLQRRQESVAQDL